MTGNPKAISVRVEHRNASQSAGQRSHDERLGRIPKYVDQARSSFNSVLIFSEKSAALRKLCEERRGTKRQKMRKTAAVSTNGIITFGKEAQAEMDRLSPEVQDQALRSVAKAIARLLRADLSGLAVHRDETALHAHFQMPAWTKGGLAVSKVITPTIASQLQDVAAEAIQKFAPGIERGKRTDKGKPKDIHKSVKQLHEELLPDIREKQEELDILLEKQRKHEERIQRLLERDRDLNEREQKRLATYQRRDMQARESVEKLKREIENLKVKRVQITEDGTRQFEVALQEVAAATNQALDMTLTNENYHQHRETALHHENGSPRQFANDRPTQSLIVRFIEFSFRKVIEMFNMVRHNTTLAKALDNIRGYPELVTQQQNIITAHQQAIKETLTELGVADQRPDVGEKDENGDPPPVLELVFSRANRKSKDLNNELANRLSCSGPSM